jgi:hypothetical protein
MEPNPVVELLPTRTADGRYIDMPKETVPRNPWAGIQHLAAPPPPELPAKPAPQVEEKGPVGLGGKPFDWKFERENMTPGRRTKVYPDWIGPMPAPKGAQQPETQEDELPPPDWDEAQKEPPAAKPVQAATVDVEDFDLV